MWIWDMARGLLGFLDVIECFWLQSKSTSVQASFFFSNLRARGYNEQGYETGSAGPPAIRLFCLKILVGTQRKSEAILAKEIMSRTI